LNNIQLYIGYHLDAGNEDERDISCILTYGCIAGG